VATPAQAVPQRLSPTATPVPPKKMAAAVPKEPTTPKMAAAVPRRATTGVKPTRESRLLREIVDAKEDLRFFNEDYAQLESTRQQNTLQALRTKYQTSKRASASQVAKVIQIYIDERTLELQE
jgi:hypothetical protein